MKFRKPLQKATLKRRYKRFLADVILSDGQEITVHCPNTGSMKNCVVPDSPCWLFDAQNPKRKYQYGLELITTPAGALAGVNTSRANHLVSEAIHNGIIEELQGYEEILPEQRYGTENSRVDFILKGGIAAVKKSACYVEVKSVTLEADLPEEREKGIGYFPDAVSQRAAKHLRELIYVVEEGYRALESSLISLFRMRSFSE